MTTIAPELVHLISEFLTKKALPHELSGTHSHAYQIGDLESEYVLIYVSEVSVWFPPSELRHLTRRR